MSANFTSVSEKANRLVQKGKHDKALAIWQRFIEHADENEAAGAHNIMGDICVRKKDSLTAVDHYLAASESYERLNFALKAIATLKKILKLDASLLEVHIRLGDLHARREMVGNAVEAYLTVARLHVSRDEMDEALAMIQKIRILDPVNIRHRLQLAAELFELGFGDQAGDETLNAVDLFLQDENLEEATRYCRHLLDLQPDNAGAKERLERISKWDVDPALAAATTTLNHDDDDPESAIDDLFAELDGDFGESSSDEAVVADRSPDEADADAPTEFNLEDMLESTTLAIPTADGEGDDPILDSMNFGQLSLDNPDTDDSSPLSPDNVLASDELDNDNQLRQQAFDRLDAGEFEASLGLFDQFVSKSLERGEFQEADTALRAYLAIDPDNARAHEVHLRIFTDRDPEREAETLEKLISLYQDSQPDRAEAYTKRLDILGDPTLASVDFGALTTESPAPPVWDGGDGSFGDAFAADSNDNAPLDINLQGGQDEAAPVSHELAEQMLDAPIDASEIDLSQVGPHEDSPTEVDDLAAELSGMDLNLDLSDDAPTPVIDLLDDSEPDETGDANVTVVDLDDPTALPDDTEELFKVSLGERPSDKDDSQSAPLPEPDAPSIHTSNAADLFQFSWSSDDEEQSPAAPSAPLAETVREGFNPTPAEAEPALAQASDDLSSGHDLQDVPSEHDLQEVPTPVAIDDAKALIPTTNFVSADAPSMPSAELRETLAEARFYEHQNLTDEAIKVYKLVLESHPNEPTAQERLNALGITPSTDSTPAKKAPVTPQFVDDGDEFAAFTNSIQDTLEKEVGTEWRRVSEDARFDEILDAFRNGISEQVSEDDSETHYDLGVAYREMGLVEEAIGEFQLAIKGTLRFADSCIMLANCFADMGKPHLGMGQLRQAVDKVVGNDESWIPLAYELGSLLEIAGDRDEARKVFEEVYSRDITFRDVAKRVETLS